MAYITLFLPARINDRFQNFNRYFESIVSCVDDLSNIEVIIKFDDDQDISPALKVVENYKKKGVKIKYLQSSRGAGYQDISYFYSQLMNIADERSYIFMAGSIDLYFVQKGFDTIFLESSRKFKDGIFVIHPSATRSFRDNVIDINIAIQRVECFPCWSRKWLEISGAFGYNSSNDGYAGLVEFILATEYGVDRRIDLSHYRILRQTDEGAVVFSDYWQGPRRNAMVSHMNHQSIAFARQAARNLALNIAGAHGREDFAEYLIESCLNTTDRAAVLSNYKVIKD